MKVIEKDGQLTPVAEEGEQDRVRPGVVQGLLTNIRHAGTVLLDGKQATLANFEVLAEDCSGDFASLLVRVGDRLLTVQVHDAPVTEWNSVGPLLLRTHPHSPAHPDDVAALARAELAKGGREIQWPVAAR